MVERGFSHALDLLHIQMEFVHTFNLVAPRNSDSITVTTTTHTHTQKALMYTYVTLDQHHTHTHTHTQSSHVYRVQKITLLVILDYPTHVSGAGLHDPRGYFRRQQIVSFDTAHRTHGEFSPSTFILASKFACNPLVHLLTLPG